MNALITFSLVLFCSTTLALAQAPTTAPPQATSPTSVKKTAATTTKGKRPGMTSKGRANSIRLSREVPDTYKGRVLTVGSGGGVVGKETTYSLLDDGRLFSRKTGETSYTYVGKQTAANTKKVFWSVEDRCAIKKTTYDNPGNIYRFVGWRKGNETYKVTWAPGDKDVPANYEQVYRGFIGMLPKKV